MGSEHRVSLTRTWAARFGLALTISAQRGTCCGWRKSQRPCMKRNTGRNLPLGPRVTGFTHACHGAGFSGTLTSNPSRRQLRFLAAAAAESDSVGIILRPIAVTSCIFCAKKLAGLRLDRPGQLFWVHLSYPWLIPHTRNALARAEESATTQPSMQTPTRVTSSPANIESRPFKSVLSGFYMRPL